MSADTKPAREPLLPCPFCGEQPRSRWYGVSGEDDDSGYWGIDCCQAFAHEDSESEAIAAWNRRITREPVAPVGDDKLAAAVKWARDLVARERADDVSRIFPDADLRHLDTLADATSRAPTEAQRRGIAEAWEELSERYGFLPRSQAPTIRRMQATLRAAGIIGGEHG